MTLRSLLAAAALVLPACAATSQELRPSMGASAKVPQIDPIAQAEPLVPISDTNELPSVDNVAMHMQRVLGDSATAEVRACVDPTGAVRIVKLLKTSGLASYDASVMADVKTWKFANQNQAQCEDLTVTYTLR